MTEKSMVKADLVTSVILVAMGIAILVLSIQMPTMADRNQSVYSAPGVVPGFIGAMITILSFAMLLRSLKKKALAEFREGALPKGSLSTESTKRILTTIVLCLLYAFLLGKLWFGIPTFTFIFAFIVIFEYDRKKPFSTQIRKLLVAALIAALTTAAVMLVFQKLFLVNLP
jgi:putative tricarboxylic transport membrane protein